jgi:ABC-2 type transport system permease protein
MRLFWELARRAFQRQMTYRAAAIAGLAANFFFGILRFSVMIALYGTRQEVAGMTVQGAVTYTCLAQGVIAFLSLFSWYDLMMTVYNGGVASDLLKPMNYFSFWLAQDFGRAIAQLILRGLTIMAAYAIFVELVYPSGAVEWLAVGAALGLAWLVSFSYRFLINLTAFWFPNALGIGRFAFILSWFTSGFLMPLRFFPIWFQRLCQLTPFPYTVNVITEVYLGLVRGPQLVGALAMQLVWALVLIFLGQLVLRAGMKRLVILGG